MNVCKPALFSVSTLIFSIIKELRHGAHQDQNIGLVRYTYLITKLEEKWLICRYGTVTRRVVIKWKCLHLKIFQLRTSYVFLYSLLSLCCTSISCFKDISHIVIIMHKLSKVLSAVVWSRIYLACTISETKNEKAVLWLR